MTTNKLQPALLGGIFIGVFSVLPFVNVFNCCCLWIVSGGVLAAYLMVQAQGQTTAIDGLAVGFLAGVIGAGVYLSISVPLSLILGPIVRGWVQRFVETVGDMPPELRDALSSRDTGMFAVLFTLIWLFVMVTFSSLGGLLGVVLFRPAAPAQPAVPEPTTRSGEPSED